MNFDKGVKVIQWRKNSLFNKNAGTTRNAHVKYECRLRWYTSQKIIQMYYTHKLKCKSINLIEDNEEENLDDLRFGFDSSDTTPKA